MRTSPIIVRFLLYISLIGLVVALGISYYYGINADYTFEVYLFMAMASLCWVLLVLLLFIFLPKLKLSKRQAWIAIHGHISIAKIMHSYTTETKTVDNKVVILYHNVVMTPEGKEFVIDYNPMLKTEDNVVIIRYDEDTAIFDNKTMRLIRKKRIKETTFEEYVEKNENYLPVPENISGYKVVPFTKRIAFIVLGIIILFNFITPTIIILTEKTNTEEVVQTTKWNDDIKAKSKNILGFELPEYDLGYFGSYYVSDSKQRLFDQNGNSGYLYPNASEFSFEFLSTAPDDDKLSSYATYLSSNYGFTKNYDLNDLEYYSDVASACSETNFTGYFHYIQLKKGNVYIVITKSFRNGYYAYMDYAAELKKGVWITCINM